MKRIFTLLICSTMLCSCYTSRILVGDVKPKEPMVEVAKKHDAHFIGGIVKTAKNVAQEYVGDAENFAIHTKFGFGDMMLSAVTFGIYTPTTTKYYIPVRHMDGYVPVVKEKKLKPIKSKGFTLMFDFDAIGRARFLDSEFTPEGAGGGMGITFAYKVNPHFIVGIGGRGGYYMAPKTLATTETPTIKTTEYRNHWYEGYFAEGFLRLRYIMLDKKCSPYINIDGGYNFASGGLGYYFLQSFREDTSAQVEISEKYPPLYITPTFGGQFRMGQNSYFNLGIGYRIQGSAKTEITEVHPSAMETYKHTFKNMSSGLVIQLGFSVTM